jgi:hypothetical protein
LGFLLVQRFRQLIPRDPMQALESVLDVKEPTGVVRSVVPTFPSRWAL